ncbi:short-chain dehydrogenase TIC 32, chloroplastic-like isoform X3 [Tripterygium wilfordii]|uniref:short-chain dehydrogenase TIC 32, chloroplastic-like isoform X3 n=1 Tax=Tripterygium wilfordii TaxID=458696 RepID=UPI0018F7E97E|nr:short-chain dehydrogenase TIC 32, chloroplastic-like isoform X3 [Tripterygium wilfordii]
MWLFSSKAPSGFSASSTAEEVTEGIDGNGLTAIVTGVSSGIGTETARVLALRGVHVVMAVRNMTAGGEVRETIMKENPYAKLHAMELDLSSMDSVKKFASDFKSTGLQLNILMSHGYTIHVFQGQHRTTICDKPYRYNSLSAYGQSKLANVLHANELARRLKEDGLEITANSVHPGAIATNLFRHHSFVSGLINLLGKYVIKNVQQGAATTCYVALHPQVKGISGQYFADCNIAEASSQAKDNNLARKLWDFSLDLIHRYPPPQKL